MSRVRYASGYRFPTLASREIYMLLLPGAIQPRVHGPLSLSPNETVYESSRLGLVSAPLAICVTDGFGNETLIRPSW